MFSRGEADYRDTGLSIPLDKSEQYRIGTETIP